MTTEKKAKLKTTVTGWLCFAAMASGAFFPGYLPCIIPYITAAAEEPDPVIKGTINVGF